MGQLRGAGEMLKVLKTRGVDWATASISRVVDTGLWKTTDDLQMIAGDNNNTAPPLSLNLKVKELVEKKNPYRTIRFRDCDNICNSMLKRKDISCS
jgi:hypothetical protein